VVVDAFEDDDAPRTGEDGLGFGQVPAVEGRERAAVDVEAGDGLEDGRSGGVAGRPRRGGMVGELVDAFDIDEHGAHAVSGAERAGDDTLAFGDEQAVRLLELRAQGEVGEGAVVAQAVVGRVVDKGGLLGHRSIVPGGGRAGSGGASGVSEAPLSPVRRRAVRGRRAACAWPRR
jgi:hypothetical protein